MPARSSGRSASEIRSQDDARSATFRHEMEWTVFNPRTAVPRLDKPGDVSEELVVHCSVFHGVEELSKRGVRIDRRNIRRRTKSLDALNHFRVSAHASKTLSDAQIRRENALRDPLARPRQALTGSSPLSYLKTCRKCAWPSLHQASRRES
jgi:hypothetical protein